MQGVEPLDHGAAFAAVEVDGVAQLAHAGVDGDEAEEDAEREEDDAEVHPAAWVIGVPYRVVAVAPGPLVAPRVRLVGVEVLELPVPVGGFVVGAAHGPHLGQESVLAGVVGVAALGADDGRFQGLRGQVSVVAGGVTAVLDTGDDLRGPGVAGRLFAVADAAAPHGLEEPVGAGVVRGGLAAPDDGPAARGTRAGRGHPGGVLGGTQVPCEARVLGARRGAQLHAEARMIDDDLRRIARHLHHAQRGSVVESRRAVPRGCAGCSGVHTHLTE